MSGEKQPKNNEKEIELFSRVVTTKYMKHMKVYETYETYHENLKLAFTLVYFTISPCVSTLLTTLARSHSHSILSDTL